MIDCNITKNYLREKARMIGGSCGGGKCGGCPLSSAHSGFELVCGELETKYPEKAIAIVRAWSDAHPRKTYLSDFLEKYPNANIVSNGKPDGICPYVLGYERGVVCYQHGKCAECWNRELEDNIC